MQFSISIFFINSSSHPTSFRPFLIQNESSLMYSFFISASPSFIPHPNLFLPHSLFIPHPSLPVSLSFLIPTYFSLSHSTSRPILCYSFIHPFIHSFTCSSCSCLKNYASYRHSFLIPIFLLTLYGP